MFKIGEKVSCIQITALDDYDAENKVRHPVKNEIYTIREIMADSDGTFLKFVEIVNPKLSYDNGESFGECCYCSTKFRKLDYEFAENLLSQIKEDVFNDKVALTIA